MKTLAYLFLIFLFALSACAHDSTQDELEDELSFIENAVAGFGNSMARKDTTGLTNFISDSVSVMHPDKPHHFGIKRFKTFLKGNGWRQFQIIDPEIEIKGNLAIVKANMSYQVNQEKPNNPWNYRGEMMLFIRKSNEGFWKVEQFVYSTWRQSNPKEVQKTN